MSRSLAICAWAMLLAGAPPAPADEGPPAAPPIRFHLRPAGDLQARPEVRDSMVQMHDALVKAGWREDGVVDVDATVTWTSDAAHKQWCAQLRTAWWDLSDPPSPAHCERMRQGWTELNKPPDAEALTAQVVVPILKELSQQEAARWVLRVTRRSASEVASFLLGDTDVGNRIAWSDGTGLLSVPPDRRVTVKLGPCTRAVGSAQPAIALSSLGSRRLVPQWSVNGHPASQVDVEQGVPFELGLALQDAPSEPREGALEFACAGGEWEAVPTAAGLDVKDRSGADGAWAWTATRTAAAAVFTVRLRNSDSSGEPYREARITFHDPWWRPLWAKVLAALTAVSGAVGLIALLVSNLRKLGLFRSR